jgi:haloalkane dehalogenase
VKTLSTLPGVRAGLADYPFAPHWASVPDGEGGALRVHYVDEEPRNGRPVVFLHDNPSELGDYTVLRHLDWMRAALIHALSLRDFVFVLHDWGGIIGLCIVAEYPDRVAGVAISNTASRNGTRASRFPPGRSRRVAPLPASSAWRARLRAGSRGRCSRA